MAMRVMCWKIRMLMKGCGCSDNSPEQVFVVTRARPCPEKLDQNPSPKGDQFFLQRLTPYVLHVTSPITSCPSGHLYPFLQTGASAFLVQGSS